MAADFEKELKNILTADPRYNRDAYPFIFEALRYTLNSIGEKRHVSGRELAEGIRDYAKDQFGGLAKMVLEQWGMHKTDDFGEIVFHLVDHGLMGKTDDDRKEDFNGVFDFEDAFPIDYSPPKESKPS